MYTLINEDLFSFRFTQDSGQQSNFPHQMEICSANELVRYPKEDDQDPQKDGEVVVNMQKVVPICRKILSVFSVDDDFTNHPMSYRAQWNVFNERPNPFVSIRCHDSGEDHGNLFIIAFPFNGRLKPIPPSNEYRILKGTIVSSVKNFWYQNKKYRKVLYLIVEPNAEAFDGIEYPSITLEGFGIYHDLHNDGAEMTKHETLKITFTDNQGTYSAESEHEIIDHAVQLKSFTGEELWKTTKIDFPKKPQNKGYRNTRNSDYRDTPQGVRVTTNKNGIRKEVSIGGGHRGGGRPQKNDKDDLDSMIKKANLVDDYEYRKGKKGRGKKNTRR